jgi:radical SAM superfamily enzyme YgiQ (UPF0313 family)
MKVTLIMPGVGKRPGQRYEPSWTMEPLALAVLASLTPGDIEVELVDDRLEDIPYGKHTDVVAINVETYTARRAYAIAAEYRRRGRRVVLGGYHATLLPEEAAEHADAVMVGEAESAWTGILEDVAAGRLQPRYHAESPPALDGIRPRRELFRGKKYLPVTLVESGRGCRAACRFCSVCQFFHSTYRGRPIPEVAGEIAATGRRNIFLIDDNINVDRDRAKELFRSLIPLRIHWISQGSLTMADDTELLDLMARSGCLGVLIGFESLNSENLRRMGKAWNAPAEYGEKIRRIHARGIAIYATFMFGYDHDTLAEIARTVDFAVAQKFHLAAFNHVVPFPGTPLYDELKREGRLIHERWWLTPGVSFGDVVFRPARMSAQELTDGCFAARRRFFSTRSILARAGNWRVHCRSPLSAFRYFSINVLVGGGARRRQGLPIGEGFA